MIQARIEKTFRSISIYTRFFKANRVYSFIRGQMEIGNLNMSVPQRSSCPACISNSLGNLFLTGDGNMSFKGKGKPSNMEPLHGQLYVQQDLSADEIKADKRYAKDCQKCSKYRADGSINEAVIEDSKLYHRGLFGTICKHRVPGQFIFMTHGGEAYIYCYRLFSKALQLPWLQKFKGKYDIACNFGRYLVVCDLRIYQCTALTNG